MREIAAALGCSENKVVYWMDKHGIKRRSVSDAIYLKYHPDGDPFILKKPKTRKEWKLYGLGIGLYWGEGNKANKHSVRLGNTDPALLRVFIKFLVEICGVKRGDLTFNIQVFSDIDPDIALSFWVNALDMEPQQFYPPRCSPSQSMGTYRRRCPFGVLSVYYNNRNLQRWILSQVADVAQLVRARTW